MKRILKTIMYFVILIILTLGGLIIFAWITAYRPAQNTLVIHSNSPTTLSDTAAIDLLSWNIGYAGLGDDMDFFYDGGSKVRSSRERTENNFKAIMEFVEERQLTDFIFLQEADRKARRSYNINMLEGLEAVLPNHWHAFGQNYKVRFVPVPFYSPMGYVDSGIITSSIAAPIISERISFPGKYPWPDRLFNLNRCFLKNHYQVSNGKQLVVINTHNSAFDDGSLRKIQMDFLREVILEEYEKGNYVIAGGDWNQCPPNFEPDFGFNLFDTLDVMYIPDNYLPGWQWVYDPEVPTNRRIQKQYHAGTTLTTVIDFFLISPNIELLNVEGLHLDFIHSDHNPVQAKIKLRNY